MKRSKLRLRVSAATFTVCALGAATACDISAGESVTHKVAAPEHHRSKAGVMLHASRDRIYGSLDELAQAATDVVIGTAGDSHVEELAGVLFTVTTFEVEMGEHQGGGVTPETFSVRQTGTADDSRDPSELSPVLDRGSKYLLFLQPFELQGDQPKDQYVIVGDQGIWQATEGDSYRILTDDTGLPETVTVDGSRGIVTVHPGD